MKVLIVSEGVHELDGALKTLVERILGTGIESESMTVRDPALRSHGGRGVGYFKKAVRSLILAQERAFDAVVFVIDQDNDTDRHRQFSRAQDFLDVKIRRAFGVAIRTFDAWMLADESALRAVLGEVIDRQPNPEEIANPKSVCEALREEHRCSLGTRELYSEIARSADIETPEVRCPKGFRVFAQRVHTLMTTQ